MLLITQVFKFHSTVAAAAATLTAAALNSVRDELAGVVYQALEPAHASVWINERG